MGYVLTRHNRIVAKGPAEGVCRFAACRCCVELYILICGCVRRVDDEGRTERRWRKSCGGVDDVGRLVSRRHVVLLVANPNLSVRINPDGFVWKF
jgi:hypothetical protein